MNSVGVVLVAYHSLLFSVAILSRHHIHSSLVLLLPVIILDEITLGPKAVPGIHHSSIAFVCRSSILVPSGVVQ